MLKNKIGSIVASLLALSSLLLLLAVKTQPEASLEVASDEESHEYTVPGIVSAKEMESIFSSPERQARRLQAGCAVRMPLAVPSTPITVPGTPAAPTTTTKNSATTLSQLYDDQHQYKEPAALIGGGLDRSFVERMRLAMDFQYLLLDEDPYDPTIKSQYDYYKVWEDFDDSTMVAMHPRDPGVCHGVIRATLDTVSANTLSDQLQNLNPFSRVVDGSDCKVRRGFYDAIFNNYLDEFRNSVAECVTLCQTASNDKPCPLVLSGLSQGGGAALVAAIELREYEPTVITFGCMKAIANDDPRYPCTDLDSSRHFKFVNTADNGAYDAITMLDVPFGYKHVGHTILLDKNNYPMAYLGLDEDVSRTPGNVAIHYRGPYKDRLDQMGSMNDACFPIPLGKWSIGHFCGYDDECDGGTCSQGQCVASRSLLGQGERCEEDSDCSSGRCERPGLFRSKRCQ